MNLIRARSGYPSDVSQEHWDGIMERLNNILISETGRGAWLHTYLYED